nr:hypothetical protein [Tanacetum cinerariifolium]
MSPRILRQRAVERLLANRVAEAIAEYERSITNTKNARGAGNVRGAGNARRAPKVRGCSYKTFMNCKPYSFNGTEGVVRLSRWFEKMESVFEIGKCGEEDK